MSDQDQRKSVRHPIPQEDYRPGAPLGIERVTFVCFACRLAIKVVTVDRLTSTCPKCGRTSYFLGKAFDPPRSSAHEEWLRVQALFAAGFRFEAPGEVGESAPLPQALSDVPEFLARYPSHPLRGADRLPELMPPAVADALERLRAETSGERG